MLAPGALSSAATTLTIPAGTASGYYYILAVADADGTQTETVETNNLTSRVLQVVPVTP